MARAPILITIPFLLTACSSGTMMPGTGGGGGDPGTSGSQQSVHLESPEFTLNPGEELFKCFYTSVPIDAAINATKMRSQMSPGSHHFIVYTTTTAERPDGTFEDCSARQGATSITDAPVWLYATQDPQAEMAMPDGVAMPIAARQPLYFDMHYINATTNPMTVHVQLDFDYAQGDFQRAGAFVTYNTQISVPPMGTQTVHGDCTVPSDANFFILSTHSHKRTLDAIAAKNVNGTVGDPIVDTTDWEHAAVTRFPSNPFLQFAAGEKLHYECSYKNDTSMTITDGESAATNEMCMAVGYYFPATATSFCLNSTTLSK
jgi:hypothetical protein